MNRGQQRTVILLVLTFVTFVLVLTMAAQCGEEVVPSAEPALFSARDGSTVCYGWRQHNNIRGIYCMEEK